MKHIGDDLERDLALIAADPVTRRWWELTAPLRQPLSTATDGQWWVPMEELFHLDRHPPCRPIGERTAAGEACADRDQSQGGG